MAEPIIAMPISDMTVRTSAKSTLIMPGQLMTSAMPATAPCNTPLAALKASSMLTSSPSTCMSFSLGITISESTCFGKASRPFVRDLLAFAFECERLGHDGYRQNAKLAGDLRHDGRRAGTGAAAHARSQEQHVGALDQLDDALAVFHRRLAADFGIGARAQALGDIRAQLQQGLRRLRLSACASVLAQMNSTPCTPIVDHVIDRIAAAAAHANHLDHRFLGLCVHDFEHARSPL